MGANSSQSVQPAANTPVAPSPATNAKKNASNSQSMKGGMAPVQFQAPRQPSEPVMQWATTAGIPSVQDGGKRKTRNKHKSHHARKTHNKRRMHHKRKTNRRRKH